MQQGGPYCDLDLSVNDVTSLVQHVTLTRLEQRASVMRPTIFQNFEVFEKFQEKLDFPWQSQSDKHM